MEIDWTIYATKYLQLDDISHFRYGPYEGLNAVRAIFDARNKANPVLVFNLPQRHTQCNYESFLEDVRNYRLDGQDVNIVIDTRFPSLRDKIAVNKKIREENDQNRVLTIDGNNFLPNYTKINENIEGRILLQYQTIINSAQNYPLTRDDFIALFGNNVDKILTNLIDEKYI